MLLSNHHFICSTIVGAPGQCICLQHTWVELSPPRLHLEPCSTTPPPAAQVDTGDRGVVALCGPTGRGAMVMGTADGSISLLDPRSGYRPEASMQVGSRRTSAWGGGWGVGGGGGGCSRVHSRRCPSASVW